MIENDLADRRPAVSVFGCGWMGLPVACRLRSEGYPVKGSTTAAAKIPVLREAGIQPYLLCCAPELSGEDASEFFASEILFLTLPFRRNMPDPEEYRRQIAAVIDQARTGSVRWIIFTSSTSVYPPAGTEVTEDDIIVPQNARQRVLRDVEQDILGAAPISGTVLRFGGLYGGDRKLGRFLGGSAAVQRDGESRVNLIHLDDCVGIVSAVIAAGATGEIFNAVGDAHPTRRELYTRKARECGLPAPDFAGSPGGPDKIVSNRKLKTVLSYSFIHPDPLE